MTPDSSLRSSPEPALQLKGISAGYRATQVLRGVDFEARSSSVVALIGANGAGKTTLLRVAAGTLVPDAGSVYLEATDVTSLPSHRRVRRGLSLIPEGRGIYRSLTVRENLELFVPPWLKGTKFDSALDYFPILAGRLGQVAGSLSGGEQQMLAISRAYLSDASVVLFDELSMGLAPKMVDVIFDSIRVLAKRGIAMVVVEQYVSRVLELADYVYLLDRGTFAFTGSPTGLSNRTLLDTYLGVTPTPTPQPLPQGLT